MNNDNNSTMDNNNNSDSNDSNNNGSTTRRKVLRSMGAAGGGMAGAGIVSGTAAADTDYEAQIPVDADVNLVRHSDTPWVPYYTYVASIHMDDVCDITESMCIYGGAAASVFALIPGAASAVLCKGGQTVACNLRADIEKYTPWSVDWAYIYRSTSSGTPSDWLLVPSRR